MLTLDASGELSPVGPHGEEAAVGRLGDGDVEGDRCGVGRHAAPPATWRSIVWPGPIGAAAARTGAVAGVEQASRRQRHQPDVARRREVTDEVADEMDAAACC